MREVICPLLESAARWPDSPALCDSSTQFTFRELDSAAAAIAELLRGRGVESGVRLAIIESNRLELAPLLWAVFRLGALAVLLNPRFPKAALADQLAASGCRYAVRFESSSWPLSLSDLRLIHIDRSDLDGPPPHPTDQVAIPLDRPATVMFTSGTSDVPKAVLHSFGNHYFNAVGSNENLPLAPGDRWLLSLPLYHVGGMGILFRCILSRACIVIPPSGEPLARAIIDHEITHVSLVPTQLQRLLDDSRSVAEAARCLKAVLLGGAAIPDALNARARKAGLSVYSSYGLTEMASQVATSSRDNVSLRVLPHRELSMAADGEILVRGNTLFLGYLEADRTRLPLDDRGWFHTGDVGAVDTEGCLTVIGRKDNMFVSGGENIHPEQIEAALNRVKGIEQALVVPIDDPEFGQRPVAFLKYDYRWLKDVPELPPVDETSIITELEKSLPRFMIPATFYPWPQGYESTGIKDDRRFFRELAARLRNRRPL